MYVWDVDAEGLGGRMRRQGGGKPVVGSQRADHDDIGAELKLSVAHVGSGLGHGEELNEAEGVAEPLNRSTRILVTEDGEDGLHGPFRWGDDVNNRLVSVA